MFIWEFLLKGVKIYSIYVKVQKFNTYNNLLSNVFTLCLLSFKSKSDSSSLQNTFIMFTSLPNI